MSVVLGGMAAAVTLAASMPVVLSAPVAAQAPAAQPRSVAAAPPAAERAAPLAGPTTVTLITGDEVTLVPDGDRPPRVLVDGREGAPGMEVRREGGRIEVIPREVARLVPAVLDPDLFDVAGLVAAGYGDRHDRPLRLIVHRAPGVRQVAPPSPLRPGRPLPAVHGQAATVPTARAADLGDRLARIAARRGPLREAAAAALGGIDRVWLDAPVTAAAVSTALPGTSVAAPAADDTMDPYLTQISAPEAWAAGLDGAGVKVAVLDSGVDTGHPALIGRVSAAQNFTDAPSETDVVGHGTHVASLLAGSGAGSAGARQGIAPRADLVSGKVLGDEGVGFESWAIAGAQWAVAQGARVVNMSLSAPPREADDPLVQAVDNLTRQSGALFVVAAGNTGGLGPDPLTITSPGTAETALTVGAVTPSDVQAFFSSEGPTRGSYRTKPDVSGPGTNLLGARAGAREGDEDLYVDMSGTSMATPLAAGAAALVYQQHPDWTWEQVKSAISQHADPLGSAWTAGGGRLALDRVVAATTTVQPSTLSPGPFLHPVESPWTATLTLTNSGTVDRTYDLSDVETDPDLDEAPADALVVSPTAVTVPAGGTATLQVIFDPGTVHDGLWQGRVSLAGDDGTSLQVPFGTYDEPERYPVDVTVLDRDGVPWAGGDVPMQNLDTGIFERALLDENGHATLRLPPGRWTAFARIETEPNGADPGSLTIAGTPDLEVRGPGSLVIDGRDAQRLRPPRVRATPTTATQFSMVYAAVSATGSGYEELVFPTLEQVNDGHVFITPTVAATSGTFEVATHWRLEPRGGNGSHPSAYELQFVEDRFPDPLTPTLGAADVARLAKVQARYHATTPGGTETVSTVTQTPHTVGIVYRRPVTVPATEVELVTGRPDALWGRCLTMPADAVVDLCRPDLAPYEAGRESTEHLGRGLHADATAYQGDGWFYAEQAISDGVLTGKPSFEALERATTTLYRDGALVQSSPGPFGWFEVPGDEARYRLVGDFTLRRGTLPVDAHTEWTFTSAAPSDPTVGQTTPPLITVDYGPAVDLLGYAPPGRDLAFALRLGHQTGSTATPRFTDVALSWSRDGGRTWRPVDLRRTGKATFDGSIAGKALRRGDVVDLRMHATDSGGAAIDQTSAGFVVVR